MSKTEILASIPASTGLDSKQVVAVPDIRDGC